MISVKTFYLPQLWRKETSPHLAPPPKQIRDGPRGTWKWWNQQISSSRWETYTLLLVYSPYIRYNGTFSCPRHLNDKHDILNWIWLNLITKQTSLKTPSLFALHCYTSWHTDYEGTCSEASQANILTQFCQGVYWEYLLLCVVARFAAFHPNCPAGTQQHTQNITSDGNHWWLWTLGQYNIRCVLFTHLEAEYTKGYLLL